MSTLLTVLVFYTAAVCAAFVLVYATRPWHRSAVGWNLMGMALSLFAAFAMWGVSRWFGPYPLVAWVLVVGSIAAVVTQRLVILVRTPRRKDG